MSKEVGEMVRSRDVVQAEGSARTEGARRATGVPADGAAAGVGSLAPGQRWSASRKRDVVLRLLRGESLEALSREVGVEIYRLDAWRAGAGHGWPRARLPRAGAGRGRLVTASPWRRCSTRRSGTSGRGCRRFGERRRASTLMVREASASAGRACRRAGNRSARAEYWRRGFGRARNRDDERDDLRGDGALFRHSAGVSGLGALALGALRAAGAGTGWARGRRGGGRRRGNRTRSCWRRFGPIRAVPVPRDHRVHARLRILDGIRVARTRVLRVMRAHGLLSPHRGRQGAAKTHDGRVITQAPNVMWGTDGVRVFTLDDGWGWIFAAVEHWNAECVGWHVCKVGSRFAALDPIAQGLERLYGSLDADVARGLVLRMDHGSQYLSDHFLKQIRYWGVHPSFGFVEEPETNGVAERWNRTLKEQAIHGRIFQNLEAVRAAVANFVERYNQTWRLEKLGYHTPIEAREEYELRQAA